MANKITLGNRPKTFPCTVTFPMLDGTDGQITFAFRYRTRTEFGAFVDAMIDDASATPTTDEDAEGRMLAVLQKTRDANGSYIMTIAVGWDIPGADFTLENVRQMCDEIPAAAEATMSAYRLAIHQGRVKN